MKIIITENQLKKIIISEGDVNKDSITLNDIWYCFKKLRHGNFQTKKSSPLKKVQTKLKNKFPKYAEEIDFRPDNDFGDKTSKMIGKLFNIKFNDLSSVEIGSKTLEKLGFSPPKELTEDEKILAITLTMEMSSDKENEIKAISNVIANRAYIRNMSPVDVVLESSQFSGWNKYGNLDVNSVLCKEKSYNKKSWETAIKYAKLLLSGAGFTDNTNGATHYYNPNNPDVIKNPPNWGKDSDTWVPHVELVHLYGRDTTTNWAKKPVKRK